MIPLDSEMRGTTALVIDGNNALRGMLVTMLREFGVGEVAQARRAQDARRILELQRFDIVVCDYHFDGEPVSGQDLMDDLRLAHLLPLATVVVMISAEAGHAKVAEAAEAALDAYLARPHLHLRLHLHLHLHLVLLLLLLLHLHRRSTQLLACPVGFSAASAPAMQSRT